MRDTSMIIRIVYWVAEWWRARSAKTAKRIDKADQMKDEALKEKDPSKLAASIDRLKRNVMIQLLTAACWVALATQIGCTKIVVKPMEGDLFFVKKNTVIETVNKGSVTTDKPGIWMSEMYFNELWETFKETKK